MRFHIFFSGFLMLAFGAYATHILEKKEALGMLQGCLTLGGGMIICGIFSIKMKWHGVIGAGVLSLIGAAQGLGNIPEFFKLMSGDSTHGPASAIEFGFTLICLFLLARVISALQRERLRRMLEQDQP
jgi:hypothetical protein